MSVSTATSAPGTVLSRAHRWAGLAALFLIATVSYADRNVLAVLLEPIKKEFSISDAMLGLLSGAPFALCYAAFGIAFGRAADRGRRKTFLLLALALWSIMTALCGVTTTLPLLFLARMGVGIGEGGTIPPSHALIAEYFPPEHRSIAFAVFTSAATAGAFIALSGGGWLAQSYSWRAAFLGMAALSVPVGIFAWIVLRDVHSAVRDDREAGNQLRSVENLRALLCKKSYLLVVGGTTCYALFAFGPFVFIPAYLVRSMGLGLAKVGTAYGTAAAIGTVIGTVGGGLLADRLSANDPRWLTRMPAFGLLLAIPLAFAAFHVDAFSSFLLLIGTLIALLYATLPPIFSAIQFVCGPGRRAFAAAILMAALNAIGLTIGPLATGKLSDWMGAAADPLALRLAMTLMISLLIPGAALLFAASAHLLRDAES